MALGFTISHASRRRELLAWMARRGVPAIYDRRAMRSMSSAEALGRLPAHHRWAVEEFRDRVRALLGDRLRDLRLFGSQVRGEAHAESDVDLLVLVDGFDEETRRSVIELALAISPWLAPVTEDHGLYHSPRSRATGLYRGVREASVKL